MAGGDCGRDFNHCGAGVFLKFWKPKRILNAAGEDITNKVRQRFDHSSSATVKAWLPWVVLSLVVFIWGFRRFQRY